MHVPGVMSLTMSCGAPGDCAAIGWGVPSPEVVSEHGGVWGKPQAVPGLGVMSGAQPQLSISCSAAGDCTAGGTFPASSGAARPFVVAESGGAWGKPQFLPGITGLAASGKAELASLSCASPGNCAAVGTIELKGGQAEPFVASEVNDAWESALVPGRGAFDGKQAAGLDAVACSSAGNCIAGGYAGVPGGSPSVAVVAEETGGTWGGLALVPGAGPLSTVLAASCSADGECAVAGSSDDQPFVSARSGGTWGSAEVDPGMAALDVPYGNAYSVSCSAGTCSAGGVAAVTGPGNALQAKPFTVDEAGGVWGQATVFTAGLTTASGFVDAVIHSVACPSPGNCTAIGYSREPSTMQAFTVEEVNGTWGAPRALPGAVGLGVAVACPAVGHCSAISGTVTSESVSVEDTASAVTLTASAPSAAYGAEEGTRFAVQVSSPAGDTPTGTVTVTAAGRLVCTVKLTGGTGTCAPARTALAAGGYKLAAAYSGDPTYVNSVSAARPLTVTKAGTKIAFALAKAKVAYGRESTERFTVTVTPRYAGVPGGKVTIKEGKQTVASMTLKTGKGTYTLTAKQFKPGKHALIAIYNGNQDFTFSTSTVKSLLVAK